MKEFVPAEVEFVVDLVFANTDIASTQFVRDQLRAFTLECGETYSQTVDENDSVQRDIDTFLSDYNINLDLFEDKSLWKSLNDVYARRFTPGVRQIFAPGNDSVAVSVGDVRMMVFPRFADSGFVWVKGRAFNLSTLLENDDLVEVFKGGPIGTYHTC